MKRLPLILSTQTDPNVPAGWHERYNRPANNIYPGSSAYR